jgi:hypothetical protein
MRGGRIPVVARITKCRTNGQAMITARITNTRLRRERLGFSVFVSAFIPAVVPSATDARSVLMTSPAARAGA